ncbi:MAG: GNAT family N-acetyltransferase [Peptostreptococcaceae bacterium]|nr:GNAT family N-acetyltransferase [Peptostreptococcaceae bacterium]
MARIKIRECTQFDKDMWVELNKEFMEYEANDSDVWDYINRISERELGEIYDDAMQSKEQILLLMIEADGYSVGFVNVLRGFSIWSRGKMLTIDDMYIRDEYRDQGLGTEAMKYIEDFARENGYKRVQALGNKTNKKSNVFYVAKGYMATDMNLFVKYFK